MDERQELETAIEVLQMKKVMATKKAKRGEFSKLKEAIETLNAEEKKIYENDETVMKKVLTEYLKEVREYMEEG